MIVYLSDFAYKGPGSGSSYSEASTGLPKLTTSLTSRLSERALASCSCLIYQGPVVGIDSCGSQEALSFTLPLLFLCSSQLK